MSIVNLPQRFQIVNGKSPVTAGVNMLPLLLLSAAGSGVGGALLSKKNVGFYVLVISNVFQALGLGLLSSLPTSEKVPVQIYPYMAMLGIGFGLSVVSMMVLTRTGVSEEDQGSSRPRLFQPLLLHSKKKNMEILRKNRERDKKKKWNLLIKETSCSGIPRCRQSDAHSGRRRRSGHLRRRKLRVHQVQTQL